MEATKVRLVRAGEKVVEEEGNLDKVEKDLAEAVEARRVLTEEDELGGRKYNELGSLDAWIWMGVRGKGSWWKRKKRMKWPWREARRGKSCGRHVLQGQFF